ncbi:hypothetical protein J4Q44_G00224480 [Coregonus suidteri]|uniref:Kinesin motor domain-containing protein n=1 Tax=Coregonus suidteri TaxID=861788 RepID=A0AAN8LIK8_9TELE
MCLRQVIMALVDVSNGKSRHICYRDSKFDSKKALAFLAFLLCANKTTIFLQDSLGGNAETYIIANVHPDSKCFGETQSTNLPREPS